MQPYLHRRAEAVRSSLSKHLRMVTTPVLIRQSRSRKCIATVQRRGCRTGGKAAREKAPSGEIGAKLSTNNVFMRNTCQISR